MQRVVEEQKAENFIIGYRFSPEELEEPGIHFEDTMFLLNTLAELHPDYFHFLWVLTHVHLSLIPTIRNR